MTPRRSLLTILAVLFVALSILCWKAYAPHSVMWNNDASFGLSSASTYQYPSIFGGVWSDQWWLGYKSPATPPSVANITDALLGPALYGKLFVPLTMLLLGFSFWLLFKRLAFQPYVCVLGGVVAGLNMHFFSVGCWGLGMWTVSAAMVVLAMAAIVGEGKVWMRAALAGLCVGFAVMDGFDVGAILSVFFAAFVLLVFWLKEARLRFTRGLFALAVVVCVAALLSFSTLSSLVGTQVSGIAGTGQSRADRQSRWDFATQWSLPKLETLRLFTPGVFGYRLDQYITSDDKSSQYWGRVGEDPLIQKLQDSDPIVRADAAQAAGMPQQVVDAMRGEDKAVRSEVVDYVKKQVQLRHSGNGEYVGAVAAMFAAFALLSAFRDDSPYTNSGRKTIFAFAGAALFALVMAWGRFSFLYSLVYYHMPYFSTIRNPVKFLAPLHICLVVLAGFGMEAFWRCHFKEAKGFVARRDEMLRFYLLSAGCLVTMATMIFCNLSTDFVDYLTHQGLDHTAAAAVAKFSSKEACLFSSAFFAVFSLTFFALSRALLPSRWRTPLFWSLLCLVAVVDLGRADAPWVRYYDYTQKLSSNPVVDYLAEHRLEGRVVGRLIPGGRYDLPGDNAFSALIHWWLENDFPYHNIQSLEIDQMSRVPTLDAAFMESLAPKGEWDFAAAAKLWKMTSTRYILANAQLLPQLRAVGEFKPVMRFDIMRKPWVESVEDAGDLTVETNSDGKFMLVEYLDALPKVGLYRLGAWDNGGVHLDELLSEQSNVLIYTAGASSAASTGGCLVALLKYEAKDILIDAVAPTTCFLMLNDHVDADWRAYIDGKPCNLLPCNIIMRCVALQAGQHTVEFKFQPSHRALFVSLATLAAGLLFCAWLLFQRIAPIFALDYKQPS